jgi:hypothetical protein
MKTALTLAAGFWLVVFPTLKAETLALPKDNPTFRVTLPEGWRTTTDDDGTIKFAMDEKTPLVTSISRKTNAHSDEEIKAFLVKSANRTAELMKLKEVKVGEISQTTNPHKVMMFALEATGTEPDGTRRILPMTGFSPKPGAYYIISSSLPKLEVFQAHRKEYDAVVNAISAMP